MTSLAKVQAAPGATPALKIDGVRQVPGYVHGLRASSVVARVSCDDPVYWRAVAGRAQASLASHLSLDVSMDEAGEALSCLAKLIEALQDTAGFPAVGAARVLALPAQKGSTASRGRKQWLLAVPSLAPAAALEALLWTLHYLNELASQPDVRELSDEQRADLQRLLQRMSRYAPSGFNNRFFIGAAYELDIPCTPLPGGVFQYGWGRRAQWLDSSFTEATSNISSRLARNKMVTSALLRQAGLPVPAQQSVKTLDEAIAAAKTLGYPVVIKPADRDGGLGVSAGLQSPSELSTAFERASKHSSQLLIEKHVEGRDYRVYVFRGRAINAMVRVPGSVTGDGVATVRSLVAQVNLDPRRGDHFSAPLARIELDQEALELLGAEGLTPDSIPAEGRFVRLRRSANVSTGGMPSAAFDRIHPDNARLCERAAQILRLDLAGIDLLMPDIARSWQQVGAAICEVNAQPQISSVALPETFARLMGELVEMRGRIPTALVLGGESSTVIVQQTADWLTERNVCVGTSSAAGLRIGAQRIRAERGSAFKDTRALSIDPSV
ncbi:MAG TPA: acetate--CoA ligase family protein, partial [Steroidobacter sp.]|nr:acetate--CoA ligase family protein [Steroidobacter sp.]